MNELDWMIEGMRRKYVWKTILVEGITGICHWNRYDGIGGQYGIQSNGDGAGGAFQGLLSCCRICCMNMPEFRWLFGA